MKVLITGGTGFVGSHTVAATRAAGHDVRLFVRSPARIDPALKPHGLSSADVEHAVGDVNDVDSVRAALEGCEAVVHAGSAFTNNLPFWKSSSLMQTNVGGTRNVLRTAHELGLDPIVYVSSVWAIIQSKPTVLTDDMPVSDPPEPYPRSKVEAELIARELQDAGASVVITYPGGVWGPHDPYWGETSQSVEAVLKGRIPVVPGGSGVFSDVREVAGLHAAVLEAGLGPRRYIVPSHSPLWAEILDYMREATGRKLRAMTVPDAVALWPSRLLYWMQSVTPVRLPASYSGAWWLTRRNTVGKLRAQEELGITPRPFDETVRDTLAWMAGTGRLKSKLFGNLAN